jgi:hypothetical protein
MTDKQLIDDAFYVEEGFGKTWKSYDKDGNPLVTSLTSESCIAATRFYLKFKQENKFKSENNEENISRYSGSVDYKL